MPDLLIELFSEEIPARMQGMARDTLKKLVTDGLVEAGLTYASAGAFSTPRRLTLMVEGLTAESRPVREERKGPNTTAPAAALEGFLRSTGLTLDQLERRADKKGEVFFAVIEKPGRRAPDIVAEVLETTIRNFPWPKSMRWGAGTLRWVRPLHSILCILSDETGHEVVPLTVDGITAGDSTEGHRFMGIGRFTVTGFDDYAAKLRKAHVLLDSAEREAVLWSGAQNLAFAAGMELVEDRGLLTEVAGLVEWPVPLMGRIADDFLHLPPEVLQTSMKEHQKFFSVKNPRTGRIEGFVTVANIETPDHGATILKGNQKVLAARLSDARFFWENDLRIARAGMAEWSEGLKAVTFHNKLGSQADRIDRVAALAREIAPLVGADADTAEKAARVAKLDLRSAMVGEFPELQGTMGRYYALEAGLGDAVANAARDHWRPKGEGDTVPTEPVSVAVALADKIDTLTGFWAIDEKPTGSKDPFALRRAALGVIRLVLGNGVTLPLHALLIKRIGRLTGQLRAWDAQRQGAVVAEALISVGMKDQAADAYDQVISDKRPDMQKAEDHAMAVKGVENASDLLAFFHDRLKVYLRDQGIRHDIIDACLAMPGNDDLTLLVKRATALADTLKTEDGANLIQGFKRANNILTQAEQKDGVEYSFGADPKFAEGPEEQALFAALDAAEAKIGPAMAAEDFPAAMAAMAALRGPIDAFFTAVQINSDNPIIRRNRLNLLHRIRSVCSGVADLTRLDG
ncbi:glycine--tRNA ligase subunit beta [Pseudogemmobacter blasticus]|uniref:Glycine--tRNA ligase beta subunit n=1 Tax=Fuscovulum blasticum DSM 2131 TaxID=1188250 RepID=A0A2T4JDX7_FUSBL|nr:glycine--tRNA ligase subunit beta [Fuscovulum blasticum]PTE16028.1 glycine--tRNA ligase subunit beta [Fuscovulum blasticum DSM 2131]